LGSYLRGFSTGIVNGRRGLHVNGGGRRRRCRVNGRGRVSGGRERAAGRRRRRGATLDGTLARSNVDGSRAGVDDRLRCGHASSNGTMVDVTCSVRRNHGAGGEGEGHHEEGLCDKHGDEEEGCGGIRLCLVERRASERQRVGSYKDSGYL